MITDGGSRGLAASGNRDRSGRSTGGAESGEVSLLVSNLANQLDEAYGHLLYELDRDTKLMGGIYRRENQIAELTREVERYKLEAQGLREKIERLENSKAMKAQRKYWAIRTRLKGKK